MIRTPDSMCPDAGVRDRVIRAVRDDLFVDAGAGTGKTKLLVDHVIELLREGFELSKLAIITFSEAAGAELRQRLQLRLEQQQDSPDQQGGWDKHLRALPGASVGTIHSFCLRILQRHPVEAGLSPGVKLARDADLQRLSHDVWHAYLHELAKPGSDNASKCGHIERHLAAGLPPGRLRALGLTLADAIIRGGRLPERQTGSQSRWQETAERCCQVLETALARCHDVNDKLHVNLQAWIAWLRAPAGDRPGRFGNSGSRHAWGLTANEMADLRVELWEHIEAVLEQLPAAHHDELAELAWALEPFSRRFNERRHAEGLLTFDDMLTLTHKLLSENDMVLRYEQTQLDRLLIDEFQDTDPLQACIARLLAGRGRGRLMVVGDPKQSIYRFRGADLGVYGRTARDLGETARSTLSANFRSHAMLIAAFNHAFSKIFTPSELPGGGLVQCAYQPLVACRPPAATLLDVPADEPRIDVLFDPGEPAHLAERPGAGAAGAEHTAFVEARWIASRLAQLREGGERVYERGADGEPSIAPLSWGRCAILYRATTHLDQLERALRELDIPYHIHGSRTFHRSDAVVGLKWVLAAAADPQDRFAVVSALRSSLFGLSDDHIARLHAHTLGTFDYRGVTPDAPGMLDADAVDACRALRELHESSFIQPVDTVVQRALDVTFAEAFQIVRLRGEQSAANLRKLLQQARTFAQQPTATLAAFVAELDALAQAGDVNEREGAVGENAGDVVHLLTVHQSKGLEFNVVALFNIASGGGGRESPLVAVANDGQVELQLRYQNDLGDQVCEQTSGYAAQACAAELHERAEHERLLYVACTRAMDRLIIPAAANGAQGQARNGASWLTMLVEAFGWDLAADELAFACRICPTTTPKQHGPYSAARELLEHLAKAAELDDVDPPAGPPLAEILRPERWHAPSRLTHQLDSRSAGTPAEHDDAVIQFDPHTPGRARGQVLGTLFHAVMEHIDLAATQLPAGFAARLAERLDRASASCVDAQLLAEVTRLAERVLASSEFLPVREALAAGRAVYREVPFVVPISVDLAGALNAHTSLHESAIVKPGDVLEGVIDVMVHTPCGWLVLDYKTDRLEAATAEQLREHYALQVRLYREAVQAVLGPAGGAVLEPRLIFVRES